MRGRFVFNAARPVLSLLETVLNLLPAGFLTFSLTSVRNVPGFVGLGIRYVLLKRLTLECGEVIGLHPGTFILSPQNLKIGDHVSIHPMCYIDATGGITIGSNVSIAHSVTIMSTTHQYTDISSPIRDAPVLKMNVRVSDDVWIGAGARILAGVEIGERVVIGAGAVVTKSIPAGSVAVGVPARVVRCIPMAESGRSCF